MRGILRSSTESHHKDRLSLKEISQALDISEAGVKSRIYIELVNGFALQL
ncbi:DNA-directed RNA polymerase specialized sigma24 family protein [Silvibacterium bohemicum]|uniref:DNA-directed RNA polymerase specialized sigma24 family protein n=1 Tax=Silvibacterium bohemicum TaxID=1577686 RepID=A0A841JRG1_9BACT|nr:DNA-directed RNA polymerase specialized sigma24 family protein [Silvibacterium bohemicum]